MLWSKKKIDLFDAIVRKLHINLITIHCISFILFFCLHTNNKISNLYIDMIRKFNTIFIYKWHESRGAVKTLVLKVINESEIDIS